MQEGMFHIQVLTLFKYLIEDRKCKQYVNQSYINKLVYYIILISIFSEFLVYFMTFYANSTFYSNMFPFVFASYLAEFIFFS